MSTSPQRPGMSLWMVALMTVLVILGGFLLIGWIVSTISFAFRTILLLVVLVGAVYLYARYKSSR